MAMVLISLQQFPKLRTRSCSLRLITSLSLEVCLDVSTLCIGQAEAMAGMMQRCCTVSTITSVVPVLRSCQIPIWIWLVNYLHLHLHYIREF